MCSVQTRLSHRSNKSYISGYWQYFSVIYLLLVFCSLWFYCQSLDSSRKWGFSRKWKLKIVEKKFRLGEKINKHTFFPMKIKMMDLWMQIEGRKLIFNMNFIVLDFFRFASRMPQGQTIQILVLTFKICRGNMPQDPPTYFFFFSLAIPGSVLHFYRTHRFECNHRFSLESENTKASCCGQCLCPL